MSNKLSLLTLERNKTHRAGGFSCFLLRRVFVGRGSPGSIEEGDLWSCNRKSLNLSALMDQVVDILYSWRDLENYY